MNGYEKNENEREKNNNNLPHARQAYQLLDHM